MNGTTPAPDYPSEASPSTCCINCRSSYRDNLAIGFSRWWATHAQVIPDFVVFCQPSPHPLLEQASGCCPVRTDDVIWMPLERLSELEDLLEHSELRLSEKALEQLRQARTLGS